MALSGTYTTAKAQQFIFVLTHTNHPPKYDFFKIKIHTLCKNTLYRNDKECEKKIPGSSLHPDPQPKLLGPIFIQVLLKSVE